MPFHRTYSRSSDIRKLVERQFSIAQEKQNLSKLWEEENTLNLDVVAWDSFDIF
jgi:hypothetical protein